MKTILIFIFICFSLKEVNAQAKGANDKNIQFEVADYDYSKAYAIEYILTENNIRIIFHGEVAGEKDSVFYNATVNSKDFQKLARMNVDTLKDSYINVLPFDGAQFFLIVTKSNSIKEIQLSNYYHPVVAEIIKFINELIPMEYAIWYKDER